MLLPDPEKLIIVHLQHLYTHTKKPSLQTIQVCPQLLLPSPRSSIQWSNLKAACSATPTPNQLHRHGENETSNPRPSPLWEMLTVEQVKRWVDTNI